MCTYKSMLNAVQLSQDVLFSTIWVWKEWKNPNVITTSSTRYRHFCYFQKYIDLNFHLGINLGGLLKWLKIRNCPSDTFQSVNQLAHWCFIFLCLSGFGNTDDHHRNPNSNNRDCLVGQLTISQLASTGGSYSGIVC